MVARGEDCMGRELNHGIQNWFQRKEKTEWTRLEDQSGNSVEESVLAGNLDGFPRDKNMSCDLKYDFSSQCKTTRQP